MFEILVSTAFSNLRFVSFLKTVQAADTSYVLSTAVQLWHAATGLFHPNCSDSIFWSWPIVNSQASAGTLPCPSLQVLRQAQITPRRVGQHNRQNPRP